MSTVVARRYDTLRPVRIEIQGERIARIVPADDKPGLPIVAPGFVDLQINGYGGIEYNSPELTIDQVDEAARSQDAFGVTAQLATCTTDAFDRLRHSFATIAAACERNRETALRIPGIHQEGPYISPADGPRGAHPLQHVKPPDWDEFRRLQDAAGGHIRLITLSPEYDEAPDFIRRAVASGVLVAIGHTQATSDQIRAAVDAGARMSTHLGNGAHPTIRRHPNYIWDQLADDRLVASLITDGHHLPPAVVKSMLRAKTAARCVLVSDITSLAGRPPGKYRTGLGEVEVLASGKLVPAGQPQLLAGAALPMHYCVPRAMQMGQIDLETAVHLASTQPAALIGLERHGLEIGSYADLTLFDLADPLVIHTTLLRGKTVYGNA